MTFKEVPHLPGGFTGAQRPFAIADRAGPGRNRVGRAHQRGGRSFTLDPVRLRTTFAPGDLGPYGEVLSADHERRPHRSSVRADAVEECWRIVSPVLAAWRRAREVPIDQYAARGRPAPHPGPESRPGPAADRVSPQGRRGRPGRGGRSPPPRVSNNRRLFTRCAGSPSSRRWRSGGWGSARWPLPPPRHMCPRPSSPTARTARSSAPLRLSSQTTRARFTCAGSR